MSAMTSQISGVSIVCSTVCASTDQRKYQSPGALAFVRGIHVWPVDSPHKGPVTRKMFPFDNVMMYHHLLSCHPRHVNRFAQHRPVTQNATKGKKVGPIMLSTARWLKILGAKQLTTILTKCRNTTFFDFMWNTKVKSIHFVKRTQKKGWVKLWGW